MSKASVRFVYWDKIYSFSVGNLKLAVGDNVIVDTDLGLDLGCIVSLDDDNDKQDKIKQDSIKQSSVKQNSTEINSEQKIKPIIRKANSEDLSRIPSAKEKQEALDFCQEMIKKHKLAMKLIDVHFSWESDRLNFAFTSANRVDFRDLVKDLSRHFKAIIRLTQIGARDEAKILGDCGSCGLKLCCQGALKNFCSITSEMAETQQVVNRGSDRISGICGRLKCCLAFEYEGYKFLNGKLPPRGTKVSVDGVKGVIIQRHVLKQTVDVKISSSKKDERDTIIEVDINRHKKKS
jgi:cell fate regulator YaaT (PSP1 superfamily)